ncbi:hypothetical protein J7K05_01445 [bacterium]|nr:hypothetical protein [bacterium]
MLNPKLRFRYSIVKEAENWVNLAKDKNDTYGIPYEEIVAPMPEKILRFIESHNRKESIAHVSQFLRQDPRRPLKELFIRQKIKSLGAIWEKLGEELIKKLTRLVGKQFKQKELTAYITHLFICDYNYEKGYFFLSLHHSDALNFSVIAHELFHFLFYDHYHDCCLQKGLSETQFQDLKEAMTVLLNTDQFSSLLLVEDQGYPQHQPLRDFIWREFRKKNDFKKVVEKTIKFLKKENPETKNLGLLSEPKDREERVHTDSSWVCR